MKNRNLKLNIHTMNFIQDDPKSLESSGLDFSDYYEEYYLGQTLVAEVSTKKCGRTKMEDRFCAIPNYDGYGQQFFYGVYDGHGGTHVAKMLTSMLHDQLKLHSHFNSDIELAIYESKVHYQIQKAFEQVNKLILESQYQRKKDGGSTALCVLNVNLTLYVINVGDSTCFHVSKDLSTTKLNNEHKPDRSDERLRIEQKGFVITVKNTARINGELSVSRAFGDPKYIDHGLTAVPEISKMQISDESLYLIIASDGFWNLVDQILLSRLIAEWQENEIDNLSQYLMEYATSLNTNFKKDNITLLIIDLQKHYLNLKQQ